MYIISDIVNVQNEILFVGAIYNNPDLYIDYSQYISSFKDFSDEAARFFYDVGEVIYNNRSRNLTKASISSYISEDIYRLGYFKKIGGFKTLGAWKKLSETENAQNYYNVLKKYSLLREYEDNGYDVSKIIENKNFENWVASDIYKYIRGNVDRIQTLILQNPDVEIMNKNISKDVIISRFQRPDMGVPLSFPICNELFRGLRTKNLMAIGMMSNAGKSRMMIKIASFLALVHHIPVQIFLNEMSIEQMKDCLLTTVINNEEFQTLHGVSISKNERDITLGLYKDNNGDYIYREVDENGYFTESLEDFVERLHINSDEYNGVIKVAEWIEEQSEGLIYAKDISSGYDDQTLEFEIRKAALTEGIKYFFYDTLKDTTSKIGDWSGLKVTTTMLAELTRQLDIFIYASIQLTDDTNYIKADELTSSNISNCKQLKHVLDYLVLFKEIDNSDFNKYGFFEPNGDWGKPTINDLDEHTRYYIGCVDKNRAGEKKKILFKLNLNTNEWYEVGEVVRKRR